MILVALIAEREKARRLKATWRLRAVYSKW
jgi:hypothetical protein